MQAQLARLTQHVPKVAGALGGAMRTASVRVFRSQIGPTALMGRGVARQPMAPVPQPNMMPAIVAPALLPSSAAPARTLHLSAAPQKYDSQAVTFVSPYYQIPPTNPNTIKWDSLGFDLIPTNAIVSMERNGEGQWGDMQTEPYAFEVVHPATDMYARRLFEGMKAARDEKGNIFIIRPEEHYERLVLSAENLGATAPTYDQFKAALTAAVKANHEYVPPHAKGALYLRIDFGVASPSLGNFPCPGESWRLRIITTPVGKYYKTEGHASLHAVNTQRVVDTADALTHLGIPRPPGSGKLLANYGPGIPTSTAAKKQGSADVLYTASHPTDRSDQTVYVGETSSSNMLALFTDAEGRAHVIRPKANGNLNSVTARGIMEIATELGATVHEIPLALDVLKGDQTALAALATQLGVKDISLDAIHLTGTAAGGKTSVDTVIINQKPYQFTYKEGNVLAHACGVYEDVRAGGPNQYPEKAHWFCLV